MWRIVVIFLFLSLLQSISFAQERYRVNVNSSLTIRNRPSINGQAIGRLKNNDIITVGRIEGQWAAIHHNGGIAYVNTQYITKIISQPTTQNKSSQNSNVFTSTTYSDIHDFIRNSFLVILFLAFLFHKDSFAKLAIFALIIGIPAAFLTNYLFDTSSIGWDIGCLVSLVILIKDIFFYDVDISIFGSFPTRILSIPLYIIFIPMWLIDYIFYILNYLQYFIQKPWRYFMKYDSGAFVSFFRSKDITIYLRYFFLSIFYIIATPLRIVNAFYFDIVVRLLFCAKDLIHEIFSPQVSGMRYRRGWQYLWQWIYKLPLRIGFYSCKFVAVVVESSMFFLCDIIVPALTMYHGTSDDASIKITKPGTWKVGEGNYAGSGIYFGITKRTAMNYSTGVIIVSRVTLGRIINLRMAPYHIRNCISQGGEQGVRIAKWGLREGYISTEWWRTSGGWWEYCLLDAYGAYDEPWRIRPLYIYYPGSLFAKRIWGGMAMWFFRALDKGGIV